jgi:hypothetical protein
MWKKLNKILHDKNDYHLDPLLKRDVEVSEQLIQSTIRIQKNLIPRKIKYFFANDKLFFVRLLAKYFLKLVIGLLISGIIVIIVLLAFGVDINFKKVPKTDFSKIPVYIPSTGDSDKDLQTILFYKRNFNKEANYIIFYPKDPSKNFKKWKEALHGLESGNLPNPYEARREGSQYWGKYQMGQSARDAIGLGKITWVKWKSNPELQEAALRLWIDILYQDLRNDIKRYDGKFLNGWAITESGIIAMAHNVGSEPTRQFLYSGGMNIPSDGSGRQATRFLILGGYDLEISK